VTSLRRIIILMAAISAMTMTAAHAAAPTTVIINQRSYSVTYDDHHLVVDMPQILLRSEITQRLADMGLAASVDVHIVSATIPRCLLKIDKSRNATAVRRLIKNLPWITALHSAPLLGKHKAPVMPGIGVIFSPPKSKTLHNIQESLKSMGLTAQPTPMYSPNTFHIQVPKGNADSFSVAANMMRTKAAAWAEPICYHRLKAFALPNDPYFEHQWHLENTGRWLPGYPDGKPGADVSARQAWDIITGSDNAIAGVLDDGIQMNHPELNVIAARNFVGFETENYTPPCDNDPLTGLPWGHGISVSGVIGAIGDNEKGVTGICQNCGIVGARILGREADPSDMDIYNAFKYVCDQGAWVVNNSWGFYESYPMPIAFKNGIDYCVEQGRDGKGAVVVWATGNEDRLFTDDEMMAYERVFAVGASDMNDKRSVYSNYGSGIDIVAPSNSGPNDWGIATTDYTGRCGYNDNGSVAGYPNIPDLGADGNYTYYFGGTSSACPLVSGIFALMLSYNPGLSWSDAMEIMRQSADKVGGADVYDDEGHSNFFGYGRANAHQALYLSGCGDTTFDGRCDGFRARWCVDNNLVTEDCAEQGLICGLNDDNMYRCIPCVPSPLSCTDNVDNNCNRTIDEADECGDGECFFGEFPPQCADDDRLQTCTDGNRISETDCSETKQRCGIDEELDQAACVCKISASSCQDQVDNDCDGYTDENDECNGTECNPASFIVHCNGKKLQTCNAGVLEAENCGSDGGTCQAWIDSAYCIPGEGSSCRSGTTLWSVAALLLMLTGISFRRRRRIQ